MKWEVSIPPRNAGGQQVTVTVEAANWITALNAGLQKVGEQGEVAANLMCDVRSDGSVGVKDFKTRRSFQLRPLDPRPAAAASIVPPAEGSSFLESKSAGRMSAIPAPQQAQQSFLVSEQPPTPQALLEHKVFFIRDEDPSASSNLVYRERLIVLSPYADEESVRTLLLHYFETLRRSISSLGGARYINIAAYAAEFQGQPPGPPIGALSWQDWKDKEPNVVFPRPAAMAGRASAQPGAVAMPMAAAAAAAMEETGRAPTVPVPVVDGSGPAVAPVRPEVQPVAQPAHQQVVQPTPAPVAQPAPAQQAPAPRPSQAVQAQAQAQRQPAQAPQQPARSAVSPAQPKGKDPLRQTGSRRRTPSQELPAGIVPGDFDTSEILAEVFEEMQDLYMTQDQESAAEFVMELLIRKIPAEAGSIFLADINTRELYFAAVRGPTADKLKGKKLIMTKGIVGFAARAGAAIAIADVRKDPRFCDEFDSSSGFVTKSVVCAPVQYEGRTFGAVEMLNRKGGAGFSEGETNVISYSATQLAEFIATSLPSAEPDFEEDSKKAGVSKVAATGTRKPGGAGKGKGKGKGK